MDKKDAGRLGGLATLRIYGVDHMRNIGKRGASTLWTRYALKPYQLNKFVLVDRATGQVTAIR